MGFNETLAGCSDSIVTAKEVMGLQPKEVLVHRNITDDHERFNRLVELAKAMRPFYGLFL
jgi:hypothetical protein